MGNTQSGYPLTRTAGALDSFVAELGPDIVYEKSLGSSRFLKTVRCRHRNGYLVAKMYIKPDPGMSLRKYQRRLKIEREALLDIPNVYSYQTFVETEKAGYLIRQWVASNLYDRISTRPFLSPVEKKWIAFQLLTALRDARIHKVAHGDIKAENILVTSWNWVYLSDFASHKPTCLPLDDPTDFSFYFDTSGRRTCYVAPERFYAEGARPEVAGRRDSMSSDGDGKKEARVTEAMDVFSAGCVIAELFREGAPLFTLSQLFKYREGELFIDGLLSSIDDAGVRDLIKEMTALDPAERPTFDTLLHNTRSTVFPEVFYSFLHGYVASINELPSSSPFAASSVGAPSATPTISTATNNTPSTIKDAGTPTIPPVLEGSSGGHALPSDADHRMERIWADYESVEPYLVEDTGEATVMDVRVDYAPPEPTSRPFHDVLPVELYVPNRDSKLMRAFPSRRRAATEDGPALIILALASANIRNCAQPSSKLRALDVLLALAVHITDEAKLDRMVPYVVDLLHDDTAAVRAAALRTLMQVLMLVVVITPSNASIFPEYIIPNIQPLVQDQEVSVRCMYAQCIVPLADTAVRYLEMGQALKAHGTFKLAADVVEYDEAHFEVSYDAALQDLQNSVQEHLTTLLVDSSSVVKRAVLHDISALCIFLGRQRTNDVLLSHMITYLNDRDWLLRWSFFDAIVDVAACAGGRSLEEYILPLMIQSLSDVEESVVARVLSSLTNLCELGLFQKMRIWELMSATLGFLYHPNAWIRQGAAAFIAAAAKHLPSSDVWAILYPSLRHFLRSDVREISEMTLLTAMKPPLSRQVFDAAVQWAMKADKTQFWRTHRRTVTKVDSPQSSVVAMRKTAATARNKSEEDEVQLTKLRQLGMTGTEEAKLMAMRDYILKLANAISSFTMRLRLEDEAELLKTTNDVELQKLKVVPQTVFLKTRASDVASRSSRAVSSSRRSTMEFARSPLLDTPRMSRPGSVNDFAPGAPFEDLRRRLTAINGSGTSLPSAIRDTPRITSVSAQSPTLPTGPSMDDLPPVFDRPGSPADSVFSNPNMPVNRAMQRFQVGSTDSQKAAPAVGSSRANATGLLEATSKMRSEGSPERSGRTSPVSVAGTVRGQQLRRPPSLLPISTYDGQEAGVNNLLEHLYLDSNREYQQDFGPKVHEGPVRRRNAVRHSFAPRDGTLRRPEATLVAHLASHSDAVTGLAVSPDHMFFVSASDDKTVKVWDTARLERNVTSKPRYSYTQHHSQVKSVCMLEGVHCFASAAEDGSLHVVRVQVSQSGALPKYGKVHSVREHRVDRPGEYITCMAHFNTDSASNLVYATTHSAISILDLRTMRTLQTMEHPNHSGPITALCLDRKRTWVVTGTASGVLTLWDIRFGLLLKTWKISAAANGRSPRIYQCVVHPNRGKGRWIMVTIEATRSTSETVPTTLVEVWDLETTLLVATYGTRTVSKPSAAVDEPREMSGGSPEPSAASAIAALVRARQQGAGSGMSRRSSSEASAREPLLTGPSLDMRAILVGHEFGGHSTTHRSAGSTLNADGQSTGGRGFMVSGSEDRKLRLWDLARVDRTTVLSGMESEGDRPTYSTIAFSNASTTTHVETWVNSAQQSSQQNRPAQRMALLNGSQQNLLKPHQDTITALACIDSPFRGGLVSADRAGVIKVWRVDGADL
ncbi:ARM repeat-containing protein [Auriscalpium vulgare]|uniref:ARM repeat-containing protein n=1 Tax=Auriscalpium vulgare TaxID=40419 RepID=A0ACB8S1L8_9AGAM|nr:ARM repeat-containing protein [Auriscalpium vulgare]